MGLINETNEQYYVGTQSMVYDGTTTYAFTFDIDLSLGYIDVVNPNLSSWSPGNDYYQLNNFFLEVSTDSQVTWIEYNETDYFTVENNTITFENNHSISSSATIYIRIRLKNLYNTSSFEHYGGYQYTSLEDVVNNFMVAYVGQDKIIPSVKRTDVMFHAKRGLQEFSYDTLKSVNSQELTIPPSLSVVIPQDYVNYVKLSWIDSSGVTHVIYPTRLTSNPTHLPIQDDKGIPIQDDVLYPDGSLKGENIQGTSLMEERWNTMSNDPNIDLYEMNAYYGNIYPYWNTWFGQRYGLDPETAQGNGWFTINDREGKFSFSSNLGGKLILLEYISDGLAYDENSKIPKLAEQALYMHIAYSILASRIRQPEYVVQRFKRDRRAALRNAKIRLSNIKIEEITQVMRGKSKIIK
ncbi:MAG TPA: hypothetical protein QF753_23030 [Victivallales bacterium]|nr:hypothetical protein [Victivallales bacterium]